MRLLVFLLLFSSTVYAQRPIVWQGAPGRNTGFKGGVVIQDTLILQSIKGGFLVSDDNGLVFMVPEVDVLFDSTSLSNRIEDLKADLGDLAGQVTDLEAQVESFEDSISVLRNLITAISFDTTLPVTSSIITSSRLTGRTVTSIILAPGLAYNSEWFTQIGTTITLLNNLKGIAGRKITIYSR